MLCACHEWPCPCPWATWSSSHRSHNRRPGDDRIAKPPSVVEVFNQDATEHGGYLYTDQTRLSSRLATARTADLILAADAWSGRRVLDVGCGDGSFTIHFWDAGQPQALTAVDAAPAAVLRAHAQAQGRPIRFAVADAHHLPFATDTCDLVLLQSILHHDDDLAATLNEALRVAPRVLIHEPNGSNPGLKVIEKVSRYHREHGEKSYSVQQLTRVIRQAGGRVVYQRYGGFVPMFTATWLARAMKAVEPAVEWLPGLRQLACAVYVLVVVRDE